MAGLFKVKALYDFEAKEEDDLAFPGGQIIDVTEEVDDNWLEGKYTDAAGVQHAGIFPREFVEKYEPPLPSRPTRPVRKQEAPPVAAVPEPEPKDEDEEEAVPAPPVPASSKPAPPPREDVASPPASLPTPAPAPAPAVAPVPAPRAVPADPAAGASAAKKPPPVAAKSNAFKDRIAAFNQGAAQPIVPILPGKPRANDFIKKPFVAAPPSSSAYIEPARAEPIRKPYFREEDPEIIRRQEQDQAAAEAAGLAGDAQDPSEDAPKPTSLKERIALLQQQQLEQAQRASVKREKKPPVTRAAETNEQDAVENEDDEVEQLRSREPTKRQSLDVARDRPRIPSTQRRPADASAPPPVPEHDIVSDGNEADQSAAGETTEDDADTIGPDEDDELPLPLPTPRAVDAPRHEPDVGEEEGATETGEEEEEEEIDEETRRKMELRERMAKMSGGFGMPGLVNPLAGLPTRGAPTRKPATKTSEDSSATSPPIPQQRTPMIPMPGMPKLPSPEQEESDGDEDDENLETREPTQERRSMAEDRGVPPPVPKDSRPPPIPQSDERGAPPVPSALPTPRPAPESRPAPPPPSAAALSPGPGSESDDEASSYAASGIDTPGPAPPRPGATRAAPPVPGAPNVPTRPAQSPEATRRTSYMGSVTSEVTTSLADKRASRLPPPVPNSPPLASRPPPPPPPGTLSRRTTDLSPNNDITDRGESDYEGDYDTDIASSAKHKDALKSHMRESSLDDGSTLADEPLSSPIAPPRAVAPRAVPPPPPGQARKSMDISRAPPPIPTPQEEEYDPFRHTEAVRSPPPVPVAAPAFPPPVPTREPELSSPEEAPARPSMDIRAPPPPPPHAAAPPPAAQDHARTPGVERRSMDLNRAMAAASLSPTQGAMTDNRQSLDVSRSGQARRSAEQGRPYGESGSIAADLPLEPNTPWWTASQPLPPVLQPRRNVDILTENEESTATKRGGQSVVTKTIYILFADYSETNISAKYDAREPLDCELSQEHKPAPAKLRQDQLEAYWQRFGRVIAEKANVLAGGSKKDATAGDGTPTGFVSELMKAHADALQPIGSKSYGALVYENLGNATTQQFDEIRPGDIVTLRGARFEGHHGAMKTKYRQEYGAGHVAVVEEWDGIKRALRIWEQGRENADGKKDKKGGVKSDKLRLGDLRSGEIRVWRVVGRDYVGW